MLNPGTIVFGDSAVYETISSITDDLYLFVSKVQKPNLNDQRWLQSAHSCCEELVTRLTLARKNMSDRQKALTGSLETMSNILQAYLKELDGRPNAIRLRQNFRSLSFAYEDLVVQCRRMKTKAISRRKRHFHLKPANYWRNVFHVAMGTTAFVLYDFFLSYPQALGVLFTLFAASLFMEVTRRFSPKWNDFLMEHLFRGISRPRERNHINSATYYLASIVLITVLFPKSAALIGVLILTLSDPAAALVGKKWGKRKLWKEKSYVGTFTFFGTAFLSTLTYLLLNPLPMGALTKLLLSLTAAGVGAIAELFGEYLDDNFTIPFLCAGVASFWLF